MPPSYLVCYYSQRLFVLCMSALTQGGASFGSVAHVQHPPPSYPPTPLFFCPTLFFAISCVQISPEYNNSTKCAAAAGSTPQLGRLSAPTGQVIYSAPWLFAPGHSSCVCSATPVPVDGAGRATSGGIIGWQRGPAMFIQARFPSMAGRCARARSPLSASGGDRLPDTGDEFAGSRSHVGDRAAPASTSTWD